MRFIIVSALSVLALQHAHAWQLLGSVWEGADEFDNIGYQLKVTAVKPTDRAGYVEISGLYKSGFDDQGECKDDSFPFTGTYYEPGATMAFTVDWYNSHNYDCRTVSSYVGLIYTDSDMKMRNLYRYPNQSGQTVESWIINWERQVGAAK